MALMRPPWPVYRPPLRRAARETRRRDRSGRHEGTPSPAHRRPPATRVRPRSASAAAMPRASGRPSEPDATSITWTPAPRRSCRRPAAPCGPVTTQVATLWAVRTTSADSGNLSRVGDHPHRRPVLHSRQAAGQRRIVGERRAGTHQHRVVASAQIMRFGPRLLAGDPLAVADAVAMRPSSDVASFSVIIGRCCVTRRRKPRLISAASSRQTGIATSMPAFLRRAMPRPETRGSGSSIATTTRPMPLRAERCCTDPSLPRGRRARASRSGSSARIPARFNASVSA